MLERNTTRLIRWRKVARDLWLQKTRTALVVLSIAVGVFAVGLISNTRSIVNRELKADYFASNPYHAFIVTEPVGDSVLDVVALMDGVTEVEGRRVTNVNLQVGPDEWVETTLIAVHDFDQTRVAQVWFQEGRWPLDRRDVALERASVEITNATLDDTIIVETLDGEQRELHFVAIVHDMEQVPSGFSGETVAYVTMDTLAYLGEPTDYNRLYLRYDLRGLTRERAEELTTAVRDRLDLRGVDSYGAWVPPVGEHWADEVLQVFLVILGVLGFFSMLLSGFLVINIISALLAQQKRQIGMMKAVGAHVRQVMGIYFATVLVLGLLSLGVAVPIGSLGSRIMSNYLGNLLNFDIRSYAIASDVLATQIAIAIVLPLVAALPPVIKGSRITVREAVSDYGLGQGQFGTARLDRWLEKLRGIPRPVLLSMRNTFRRKGRLALTLVTLSLGGAMFVSVLTVRDGLFFELDNVLRYFAYDVEIAFEQPQNAGRAERLALEVPGVVGAEAYEFAGTSRVLADGSQGTDFFIMAPPLNQQHIDPVMVRGRWLEAGDTNAIVLNLDVLAEEPDLDVGDQVTLRLGEKEIVFDVVGIAGHSMNRMAFVDREYLTRIQGNLNRTRVLTVSTEQHDVDSQQAIANQLEEHFRLSGMPVADSDAMATIRETNAFQFNIIVTFLMIMALLLGVVGGLGLAGTMSLNVIERTREIGVLRAIGGSTRAVLGVVMAEGLFIGFVSWVLSALVSLPLAKGFSALVGVAFFDVPLTFTYSVDGAVLWLGIVMVVAALASLFPALNASRTTVREALAYE